MTIDRRGFFGILAGFLAAPRASWKDLWRPADLIYAAPKTTVVFFSNAESEAIPPHSGVVKCVIGSYTDYYAEHDGMVEIGPGCRERLDARIAAMEKSV